MIDKALIAIQLTGPCEIATREWAGFGANQKTWHQLNANFTEAYDRRLSSGAGTAIMADYHRAANVVDDDSLGSITQIIANMQMANNVNVQVLNKNISTIIAETRDLYSTLAAAQQQIAALLVSQRMAAPPTPVTVYIPIPTPAYIPAPPPAYATPPLVVYATAAVPTYVPAPPAAVPTYIPVQPSPYQG